MPHITVLKSATVSPVVTNPDGIYLDVTGGGGGHTAEILSYLSTSGRVITTDCDGQAVERLKKIFIDEARVTVVRVRFSELKKLFEKLAIKKIDGLVADLGFSSFQVDDPQRGISFLQDGPLDMRLDQNNPITAETILSDYDVEGLTTIFKNYGEERHAGLIARAIVHDREHKAPFVRTKDLSQLAERVLGRYYRHEKKHPATRIFQALRIEVNQELAELEALLDFSAEFLKGGGRGAYISFHSLEDRLVKFFLRNLADQKLGKRITKKPIVADEVEQTENPRSRSAKLRVFEFM